MGLIYKEVELLGQKGQRKVQALFDTGASESFVRKDVVSEILQLVELTETKIIETATETAEIKFAVIPELVLDGYKLFWTLNVVDNLSEEMILGADFFQRWKIQLDPETEKIIWDPKALKLKLL